MLNAGTEDNSLRRLIDEKKIEYQRHNDDDDGTMTTIRNLPTEAKGKNATNATLASTRPLLFTLEEYGRFKNDFPVHTVKGTIITRKPSRPLPTDIFFDKQQLTSRRRHNIQNLNIALIYATLN